MLGRVLELHWFLQVSGCLGWGVEEGNGIWQFFCSQRSLLKIPALPEHVLRVVNKLPSSISVFFQTAASMLYLRVHVCCAVSLKVGTQFLTALLLSQSGVCLFLKFQVLHHWLYELGMLGLSGFQRQMWGGGFLFPVGVPMLQVPGMGSVPFSVPLVVPRPSCRQFCRSAWFPTSSALITVLGVASLYLTLEGLSCQSLCHILGYLHWLGVM